MSVLGVDISHYQSRPDIPTLQRQGVEYCGIKAWEGSSPDPDYATNVAGCIDCGMPYWAYVYLHASDTDERMAECFDHVGEGVVLALDWEDESTPAEVVEAWMDAYEQTYGRRGLAYYGLYPPEAATARIGEWPRWFPRYNSVPGIDPYDGSQDDWRNCYGVWQYSAQGQFAGLSAEFDLNELAPGITIEQFAGWLAAGGDLPPPSPHPPEPPVLQKGDEGPWVRVLQRELSTAWLVNDGDFGPSVDYVVRGFQQAKGLTVDGVVGSATWSVLRESAAASTAIYLGGEYGRPRHRHPSFWR